MSNTKRKIDHLECKNPFVIKSINILLFIFIIIMINGNIIQWVVFIFILVKAWMQFPDIILSDEGIEVLRWGRKTFLPWDNVANITVGSFYFRVHPKMPIIARILFYDSFLIISWYSSYKEALKYIEARFDINNEKSATPHT